MAERWVVPSELAGERTDRIVAVLGGMGRAEARRLVDDGAVLVDGEPVSASSRLTAGRVMDVSLPAARAAIEPAAVPFRVVFADGDLVVVDKPSGVVVHPGAGHRDDTLLNGLVARYPDLVGLGEAHRFGIVHRLDRDTSGLLVVARSAAAHEALTGAMRRREIERRYLALAAGLFEAESGTIDAPLRRDPRRPTLMTVRPDGRQARTHYTVMAVWDAVTLLDVRLETGRTHQIRVHMSSIGSPLCGDAVYGNRGGPGDPGRVWLHAGRLSFVHPMGGGTLDMTSPLPDDLVASLERLGPPVEGGVPPTVIAPPDPAGSGTPTDS